MLFLAVFVQGWFEISATSMQATEDQKLKGHYDGTPVRATLSAILVNQALLGSFLAMIVTQVMTQFLATLVSSWLFLLPPSTLATATVSEVLPVSLLSLVFFWLGGRAIWVY